jgi:hypothetical protein
MEKEIGSPFAFGALRIRRFFSYRKPTKVRLFRVQFDSHFDAERAFR